MSDKKVRAIVLGNEINDDHAIWLKACMEFSEMIEWRVVNLTRDSWWEDIHRESFDVILAKPSGYTAPYKQLFDERIYVLGKVAGYTVYPSVDEILICENKRLLSFWLRANEIPHPSTHVFFDQKEALGYCVAADMPIVAKTNIGASGSGVRILDDMKEVEAYIRKTFSGKGAERRIGPNLAKGDLLKRGLHYVLHPGDIRRKLGVYRLLRSDAQNGFVILQEFVPHEFEWRVVRIGASFFAHKKLKSGEKASGSLIKGYGNPPLSLLDFVKTITDKHGFFSQAVDIFESRRGYLVNEMQCIFGQSDPFQMLVDGKPGRYLWNDGRWTFEEGDFNGNESFNLRVQFAIELIKTVRGVPEAEPFKCFSEKK